MQKIENSEGGFNLAPRNEEPAQPKWHFSSILCSPNRSYSSISYFNVSLKRSRLCPYGVMKHKNPQDTLTSSWAHISEKIEEKQSSPENTR